MKNENNLFSFATSELSHDAFICYLLNWFNYSNPKLKKMATDIVSDISGLSPNNIKSVKAFRQLSRKVKTVEEGKEIEVKVKIDVLAIVNNNLAIVIEDKTNTTEHSKQIKRYKQGLQKLDEKIEGVDFSKIFEEQIMTVYWKSGFWYDYDRVVVSDRIVNREKIKEYIKPYIDNNSIIKEYYSYLLYLDAEEAEEKRYWENDNLSKYHISQQSFLRDIFTEELCHFKLEKKYEPYQIYNGSSKGRPWSEMVITYLGDDTLKNNNSVFWRVDTINNKKRQGPYLALRVYAEKRYDENHREIKFSQDNEAKDNHIRIYSELYEIIKKEMSNKSIKLNIWFNNPNPNDRESTLFYICLTNEQLEQIKDKGNVLDEILKVNEISTNIILKYKKELYNNK